MFTLKNKEYRIKWETKYILDEEILNPKPKSQIIKNEFFLFLKIFIVAVLFGLFITNFIIINAVVPTGSMKDTIQPNDKVIANRLSYVFSKPERLDIIVFKYPDNESENFIKRIIGLPGETIQIIDGEVYIDNSKIPLNDPYVTFQKPIGNFGPYIVPENHYFVLGDNRNDSKDSRYWKNKFVSKDKILGKVIFKYYPKFVPFF